MWEMPFDICRFINFPLSRMPESHLFSRHEVVVTQRTVGGSFSWRGGWKRNGTPFSHQLYNYSKFPAKTGRSSLQYNLLPPLLGLSIATPIAKHVSHQSLLPLTVPTSEEKLIGGEDQKHATMLTMFQTVAQDQTSNRGKGQGGPNRQSERQKRRSK